MSLEDKRKLDDENAVLRKNNFKQLLIKTLVKVSEISQTLGVNIATVSPHLILPFVFFI